MTGKGLAHLVEYPLSHAMRKCVLCHMQTTKVQISLRIRAVWSVQAGLCLAWSENPRRFVLSCCGSHLLCARSWLQILAPMYSQKCHSFYITKCEVNNLHWQPWSLRGFLQHGRMDFSSPCIPKSLTTVLVAPCLAFRFTGKKLGLVDLVSGYCD